jgi:hypothetical protein
MVQTSTQFDAVISRCKDIFIKKLRDYGAAWRILRIPSLTDQIYIKAQRIRSIEDKGVQKIDEGVEGEYIAMINYSIIALLQMEKGVSEKPDMDLNEADQVYSRIAKHAKDLMENKNHDYGEAWRNMRISSLTDLILVKLLRIKQIEDNKGQTLISEGIDANFYDIINYAVFALIRLEEVNGDFSKLNR